MNQETQILSGESVRILHYTSNYGPVPRHRAQVLGLPKFEWLRDRQYLRHGYRSDDFFLTDKGRDYLQNL